MNELRTDTLLRLVEDTIQPLYEGRVEVVSGVMVEATGVPAALGELCRIHRTGADAVEAEVCGWVTGQGESAHIGVKNLVMQAMGEGRNEEKRKEEREGG